MKLLKVDHFRPLAGGALAKTLKTMPYLAVGDETGNLFTIRHQAFGLVVTLPVPIFQVGPRSRR
jgi:hypothetical protein